jgi:hypothetical protein
VTGPHWWCACSAGSGAPSFHHAASGAAEHYLSHLRVPDSREGSYAVLVFDERGASYPLDNRDQAWRVKHQTRMTYLTPDQARFIEEQAHLIWMFETALKEGRAVGSSDPRWLHE